MKPCQPLAAALSLLVFLTACASMSKPIEPSKIPTTPASIQTIQPTQVVIPADLDFSTSLVKELIRSGLSIMSVQSSTYMSMFQSTNQAVWIKTNEGIVEAVFFPTSAEVEQIHISEQTNIVGQPFRYTIQAPPPTLVDYQTIDAEFPLYFTAKKNMLMITSSEELDKTLKKIFSGQ